MPETLGGLEKFATEVAELLEVDPAGVSADNRLVADLDFDSLAFVELGILLMERYGSQNFMAAVADELDVEGLTVRSVFENYAS
jgi:acyl carrier protein